MFGRDGRHKDSLVTVNRKYPSPETSNANGYTLQEQHIVGVLDEKVKKQN